LTRRPLVCAALLAALAAAQPIEPGPAADSARGPAPDSVMPYPTRSPGTAVLLSLLLPAGGQVYTRDYWKVPIIAPAELALGYLSYREHASATAALGRGDTVAYARHRDRRATFLWFTGATIAFSMADAYVSAQMFGFKEQLRLSLGPGRLGVEFALSARARQRPAARWKPCPRS